jgi:hypothetical protein
MFGRLNVFAIFGYTLDTKSTVVSRSAKGKWYFSLWLKILKKIRSSKWNICVVWPCWEDPSYHSRVEVRWGEVIPTIIHQSHGVLLLESPLDMDSCDVGYESRLNMFSKRFVIDLQFLTFFEIKCRTISISFFHSASRRSSSSCDTMMYGITCSSFAAMYSMIVMWFRLPWLHLD